MIMYDPLILHSIFKYCSIFPCYNDSLWLSGFIIITDQSEQPDHQILLVSQANIKGELISLL